MPLTVVLRGKGRGAVKHVESSFCFLLPWQLEDPRSTEPALNGVKCEAGFSFRPGAEQPGETLASLRPPQEALLGLPATLAGESECREWSWCPTCPAQEAC